MKQIEEHNSKIFDNIKHTDENGCEYWSARELAKILEYKDWRNFQKVIDKAVLSANNSVSNKEDWLVEFNKPIKTGKGKEEVIKDYKLSRYICYLIVQNADPSKDVVALGQTYFAIQTRKQELTEIEFSNLSEIDKNEEILDYMGSTELAANLFRITQTDEVLKNKKVNNEKEACVTHHNVGRAVRQTIKKIGGTMPEDLPTPKKSIKELTNEKNEKLKEVN